MHPRELRDWVLVPVCAALGDRYATPAALELLLGIAAHESRLGHWLDQAVSGPGPAYGIFQMEAPTLDDTLNRAGARWPELAAITDQFRAPRPASPVRQMQGNLYWATAAARLKLWLAPPPLPAAGDLAGQAAYWKRHWNTPAGAGTPAQYAAAWRELVAPHL